jgi:hypothetical protein
MAELDFIIYKTDQRILDSLGNRDCYVKPSIALVYDDDGVRGDFGIIQTVLKDANVEYIQVFLKYNQNFDWSTGGEVELDDIQLADGDKVYLASQSVSSENGIYIVRAGSWEFNKTVDSTVFVDLGARATDETDGDLTRTIITDYLGIDFGTVGFYSIYYYVVNSDGILSKVFRKVKVVENANASIVPMGKFKITQYEILSSIDPDIRIPTIN